MEKKAEVIARRCGWKGFIVSCVLAIAYVILSLLVDDPKYAMLNYVLMGIVVAFAAIYCTWKLIKIFRTPQKIILYQEGKLKIYTVGGWVECRPADIQFVDECPENNERMNVLAGAMEICLRDGRTLRVENIADLKYAKERLIVLKTQDELVGDKDSHKAAMYVLGMEPNEQEVAEEEKEEDKK